MPDTEVGPLRWVFIQRIQVYLKMQPKNNNVLNFIYTVKHIYRTL